MSFLFNDSISKEGLIEGVFPDNLVGRNQCSLGAYGLEDIPSIKAPPSPPNIVESELRSLYEEEIDWF